MTTVAVLSTSGKKLMPTNSYRARKLLKSKRAVIYKHRPIFTIKLVDRIDGYTQTIEYKCDTGYQNIGISICSDTKEFVNEQRDLLKDETERHNNRRKYRRTRRNRLRYRKARWNNRKGMISKDGFAPSIRNKRDVHIRLYEEYYKVFPITKVVFEMGQFDTQVLKAVEAGLPVPEGMDYQQGEQYGYATLREAVFARDNYTCICCGKSAIKDGVKLKIHHIGYLSGDRSNRMENLSSVCENCHTPTNHKPGGKLYNLKSRLRSFKGATFMTMVRYSMVNQLKAATPDVTIKVTYGAATKLARKELNVKKTHSNDAYCMGKFHPKYRSDFKHYKKCRRNNRVLSKFYDAKYRDIRDGSVKTGSQLSCGRTNRSIPRHTKLDERIYRAYKISKGRVSTRRQHYSLRPGDKVLFEGQKYFVAGIQNNGDYIKLTNGKVCSLKKVRVLQHCNAWAAVFQEGIHPTTYTYKGRKYFAKKNYDKKY